MKAGIRATIASLVALLATSTVGCGESAAAPKERPLTFEEATQMAELLYGNYTDSGAQFVVSTVVASGGAQLTLQGEVDWKNHRGITTVSTNLTGATLTGVIWGEQVVFERRPAFDQVLMGIGYGESPLIARAPSMNLRVDQVLAILTGLATEQRDNAQLILQTEGSAFLRDDSLRGRAVHVFRYGTRNIYWVDAETGKMLRLEATSANAGIPTIVDIIERKTVVVPEPPLARVVNVVDIPEIYQSVGQL